MSKLQEKQSSHFLKEQSEQLLLVAAEVTGYKNGFLGTVLCVVSPVMCD